MGKQEQNLPIRATDLLDKKVFVFDMDGTIYLGDRVIPGALSFVSHLREKGKTVLFFTNNASRSKEVYRKRLSDMGFTDRSEEILTSGDVTIAFLKRERPGQRVYLLGTRALWDSFRLAGIPLVNGPDGKLLDDGKPEIVVTSFDTELTYEKLLIASRLIRSGAEFLSTHPDVNCPSEEGFMPDSGSITALLTASTGERPRYFGKPYPETLTAILEKESCRREDVVFLGDRLYTDIAIGKKNGVTALLVLSGETRREDLRGKPESERPDLIFEDLGELDRILFS